MSYIGAIVIYSPPRVTYVVEQTSRGIMEGPGQSDCIEYRPKQ